MHLNLIQLELLATLLGVALLLADLFMLSVSNRKWLGNAGAAGLLALFGLSFTMEPGTGFDGIYVLDEYALFFKRFFLACGIFVMVFAADYSKKLPAARAEYFAFLIFALVGMMFSSSANDFSLLFVSVELITITFYVLVSFQKNRMASLEAGVKYLILGAVSSAIMVYGIALVFGEAGSLKFSVLHEKQAELIGSQLFLFGLLFVFGGLAFKISAFPFQVWAPDVYQGAPTPTTAFLAVGSKAAGFALLIRLFFDAVPDVVKQWSVVLMVITGATILYGNLCALPQRNLKRLLAYSGIANAGYLLLGVMALSPDGKTAVLYYLAGYLFTLLAAFIIVEQVSAESGGGDIDTLAGLNTRSPFLAFAMTLAAVSLAGIPPLAGFFGKFLLIKAFAAKAFANPAYFALLAVAVVGVVISICYYFGIVRTIYWSRREARGTALAVGTPVKIAVGLCVAGILWLGILPSTPYDWAQNAAKTSPSKVEVVPKD